MLKYRQLAISDHKEWKRLRLEALQKSPENFESSFEEEQAYHDKDWIVSLEKNAVFGAFAADELVGTSGFFMMEKMKMRHRGVMFAVYVAEASRGQGICDQLIKMVTEHARKCVLQLHCVVATDNHVALQIYKKHGFTLYGTEPSAIKVGKQFIDEHLMVLKLIESKVSE